MQSRAGLCLVAVLCASLAGVGCGRADIPAEPSDAPVSSPSTTAQATPGPVRVRPTFASSPIRYSLSRNFGRARILHCDGVVRLHAGPVAFTLGFLVDGEQRDNSSLLTEVRNRWQSMGTTPGEFEVDGTTAYWYEEPLTAADGSGNRGTELFYVLAKGSVTLTLTVSAPEGADLAAETRDAADELVRSVRIDESALTAISGDQQLLPSVPFTFDRPQSLSWPGLAEAPKVYWTRYELDGQTFDVNMRQRDDAAGYYAGQARAIATTKARTLDLKTELPMTIGRQVDEGLVTAPSTVSGIGFMYFLLRKENLIVEVRSSSAGPVPRHVQDVITNVVTTMHFM